MSAACDTKILPKLRQFINQFFCFLPSQTGVRDGFSITVLADFLGSVLDIAFNHQPFHKFPDIGGNLAAVQNVFADPNLL